MFRRQSADDNRQVIRRAGGNAQSVDFFAQKSQQRGFVQQSARFLEQKGFVRRTAAFGNHQKTVFVAFVRHQIDLGGQVCAAVFFRKGIRRDVLRQPQIQRRVRFFNAVGQGLRVCAVGQNGIALFAENQRRSRVLAQRQNARRSNARVFQKLQSRKPFVRGGVGRVKHGADLP